jgi:hypothetical protein
MLQTGKCPIMCTSTSTRASNITHSYVLWRRCVFITARVMTSRCIRVCSREAQSFCCPINTDLFGACLLQSLVFKLDLIAGMPAHTEPAVC